MKHLTTLTASIALTLVGLFPLAAMADMDELDVTMEVLDRVGDFDGQDAGGRQVALLGGKGFRAAHGGGEAGGQCCEKKG